MKGDGKQNFEGVSETCFTIWDERMIPVLFDGVLSATSESNKIKDNA